jgi:hypothetical protein
MSSNINPNNIDGTYPIAGQDNNSQGFRDNFTQTKVNFQYAAEEITALQDNVLLKGPLTAGGTVSNNLDGTLLYDATMQDFAATRVDLGTVSGTCTVNYASGHYQTVTISSGITLAFTNFPAATASISSRQGFLTLAVTATAGNTMTLPAAVGAGASAARRRICPPGGCRRASTGHGQWAPPWSLRGRRGWEPLERPVW